LGHTADYVTPLPFNDQAGVGSCLRHAEKATYHHGHPLIAAGLPVSTSTRTDYANECCPVRSLRNGDLDWRNAKLIIRRSNHCSKCTHWPN
jgi:hypothetical protein